MGNKLKKKKVKIVFVVINWDSIFFLVDWRLKKYFPPSYLPLPPLTFAISYKFPNFFFPPKLWPLTLPTSMRPPRPSPPPYIFHLPLLLPPPSSPSSSPLESVRYCLKSEAAVWWLKCWQIDTFTHDRTPADDRTASESDEEREKERGGRRGGGKITSWQQGGPYFHELRRMDNTGTCVCFYHFILHLLASVY